MVLVFLVCVLFFLDYVKGILRSDFAVFEDKFEEVEGIPSILEVFLEHPSHGVRQSNSFRGLRPNRVVLRAFRPHELRANQHHQDDHWFHQSRAFNELSIRFSVELKELFDDRGMRPGLAGHILVELFLDAHLHQANPGKLDYFYQQVSRVDVTKVQAAVNKFSTRRTDRLAAAITRFVGEKYVYDYSTDRGIVYRINRVFARIGLDTVKSQIFAWMPTARSRVYDRSDQLLIGWSGV